MSLNSKRLRWIRESLRRPDGRPVDKGALSRALGWPDNRWKNLEGPLVWGKDSEERVREGLIALVARTTLPEEAGPRAVRYVMGESKALPWSEPPTWREGMCPEGKPVGRPPRALSSSAARREAPVTRPIFPEAFWRDAVGLVLSSHAAGELATDEAIDALADLRNFYNKHEAHEESPPFGGVA